MQEPVDSEQLVKSLIERESEEDWFEFKENLSDPNKIGQYISSLANSAILANEKVAYLIFGVCDETKEIVGTSTRLKTQKKGGELLANYLSRSLTPRIDFNFSGCEIAGKRVEILSIDPAYTRPVKFLNVAYVRVESAKRRLDDCQEKERALWIATSRFSFEDSIAISNLSSQRIFELFDCRGLARLLGSNEASDGEIFRGFLQRELIIDNLQGGFDCTNLFALVAAKDLSSFPLIAEKAPRVIVYKGTNKKEADQDITGKLGYAVTFKKLLNFIMNSLRDGEVVEHGVRKKNYRHPEIAVREFLANSLIHQDLVTSGFQPRIEIFEDKVKITNPGAPLVATDQFICAPARSRNVKLAKLMRECGLCEERGSGVETAVRAIEKSSQGSPLFEDFGDATVVTLYNKANFTSLSVDDRVRACYQHAQIAYLDDKAITNSSLRIRLGLNKNQSASATGVINETIKRGLIRAVDPDQGNKNSRYVPYYAS
jgi:predicted HTH transcriptional regulator